MKKIFCISFQRTGTTSTGRFFNNAGYKVATWTISYHNQWTNKWFEGNYDAIINSDTFKNNEVFEDDPWWCCDFYKYIYHKIPNSQFLLFERDPNKWFDSMRSHSNGRTPGNSYIHCYIYNRLNEYHALNINDIKSHDRLLTIDESHRNHYTNIYKARNIEIKKFFDRNDRNRLIYLKLEDPNKWHKIGKYFNIKNISNDDIWIKP